MRLRRRTEVDGRAKVLAWEVETGRFHPLISASGGVEELARRISMLSIRERQVLEMFVTGGTVSSISRDLWVTEQTVVFHRHNIVRRLRGEKKATASPRELSADERATLSTLLGRASFPGASELALQARKALVCGGTPMLLHLLVPAPEEPACVPNGIIPARALVGTEEAPNGEILVWVSNGGYLSVLEFAWFANEPPNAFPSAEQLLVR
jgi:DNA-binding CsgD family transcriptional regulator